MKTLIVIPARLKATRLPNKPLAMVGDAPMIVQVWRRAMESGVGEVVVACDGEEIAGVIRGVGGVAIITDPDHPSGSDRIWEAVARIQDSGFWIQGRVGEAESQSGRVSEAKGGKPPSDNNYDIIINLQGDVPTLEPRLLRELLVPLANPAVDIATLAAEITRTEEHENPSVVKAILSFHSPLAGESKSAPRDSVGGTAAPIPPPNSKANLAPPQGGSGQLVATARALYFTRAIAPANEGPRYHHIGVYAYRRAALEKFVSLPPSPLELREKLEQLRALEAGMRIDAVVVDTVPLGVDTPEDLARAQEILVSGGS
ncbi:MAG: 3-deoxy-manno-octulosonate cytidylyltransferase [Rickettsiales bacterium]